MRVSAVIPAYNAASHLERAVESLFATGHADLEVSIVDDGSTDRTPEVAERLRKRHAGKIRVLRHPNGENIGVSASRNLGIRHGTGEAVCFLDADDFVYPHRFRTCIPMMESDREIDAVYEWTRMVFTRERAGDPRRRTPHGLFGLRRPAVGPDLLAQLLDHRVWATSAILVRRSFLGFTGLFHIGMAIAEDCHLWFRMAAAGRVVPGNMEDPVSAYVRHDRNTFRLNMEHKTAMVRAMAEAHRWARARSVGCETMRVFSKGLVDYVLRGMIAAREAERPDLAWRIFRCALRYGCFDPLASGPVLGQLAHLALERFGPRRRERATVEGQPSSSTSLERF